MKKTLYILCCGMALFFCGTPGALAQNAGNTARSLGQRFKDAVTSTYNDAVSAIKGESNRSNNSRSSTPRVTTTPVSGTCFYVNAASGSNRNAGTSVDAPFKNIQKAIDAASDGATILVAEGNYFGTLRSGNINIDKPVTILGGYNADFTHRDVLTYRTTVCPSAESNETQSGKGTMQIKVRRPGTKVTVNGLFFDRGNSIAYNPDGEGKVDGVESARMQPFGTAGKGGEDFKEDVLTAQTAEIFLDNAQCDIEIRNCAFINAPDCAIRGTINGQATLSNNVFVGIRKSAVEIAGSNFTRNSEILFLHNTVLFVWPADLEENELGYAYRFMNGVDSHLDHNILGCCWAAALDRCRVETLKEKEANKVTTAEYNIFFRNGLGDIALPGGDRPILVRVQDFDDVEQLSKVAGNQPVDDPELFDGVIDEAYLDGFETSETMYMNRYPFEQAIALFGAVEEYGAQPILPEEIIRKGKKK